MALGTMAANPGLQVQIVPVGLSYFHPERFRSRAVVEFGKPIPVPQELVDHFKRGGSAKRDATSKLLDVIYEALKTVTLRAPDYDTLMVRTIPIRPLDIVLTMQTPSSSKQQGDCTRPPANI